MATFAQPTADANLVPGWDVQGNVNPGGETGYAQVAPAGAPSVTTGQTGAGVPQPLGTGASAAELATPILENPGYASVNPVVIQHNVAVPSALVPVPASNAVIQSPSGLSCSVVISGGTLTAVKVGTAGQTFAQAATVGSADGTYTVPPGGVIGITYSVAPTWAWTTN